MTPNWKNRKRNSPGAQKGDGANGGKFSVHFPPAFCMMLPICNWPMVCLNALAGLIF
jgi:hypothetical protein